MLIAFPSRLPEKRGGLQVKTLKNQVFPNQSFPHIISTKSLSLKIKKKSD